MKTQKQHTPLPWHFDNEIGWYGTHPDGLPATLDLKDEANAAFIVRAVNAHEELVGHLKWALLILGEGGKAHPTDIEIVRQAISEIEGR